MGLLINTVNIILLIIVFIHLLINKNDERRLNVNTLLHPHSYIGSEIQSTRAKNILTFYFLLFKKTIHIFILCMLLPNYYNKLK